MLLIIFTNTVIIKMWLLNKAYYIRGTPLNILPRLCLLSLTVCPEMEESLPRIILSGGTGMWTEFKQGVADSTACLADCNHCTFLLRLSSFSFLDCHCLFSLSKTSLTIVIQNIYLHMLLTSTIQYFYETISFPLGKWN